MTVVAPTSIAIQFGGVTETLRRHGFSGAILGPAGVGKTCVATAIARSTPLTHLVTATDAFGRKPNILWQVISDALGIWSEESAADTQITLFHHCFKQHVLIVDEAQQLPPVQLREILTLWERCGLSVCFVGNMDVLHRSRSRQGGWDQIESRLDIVHKLEGFDDGDAAALASAYDLQQPEALELLRAIGERHYARGVVHVLEAAKQAGGDRPAIDAAAIRKTLQIFPKYRPANARAKRYVA
jgi:DNA transposition AAA+ family ATPase